MFEWVLFDGMLFPGTDLLQTDGLPLRGWDKKDPGFVFETGVFVWKEREDPFVFVDVRTFLCRGSYERLMSVTSKPADSTARMSSSKIKIIV